MNVETQNIPVQGGDSSDGNMKKFNNKGSQKEYWIILLFLAGIFIAVYYLISIPGKRMDEGVDTPVKEVPDPDSYNRVSVEPDENGVGNNESESFTGQADKANNAADDSYNNQSIRQ